MKVCIVSYSHYQTKICLPNTKAMKNYHHCQKSCKVQINAFIPDNYNPGWCPYPPCRPSPSSWDAWSGFFWPGGKPGKNVVLCLYHSLQTLLHFTTLKAEPVRVQQCRKKFGSKRTKRAHWDKFKVTHIFVSHTFNQKSTIVTFWRLWSWVCFTEAC